MAYLVGAISDKGNVRDNNEDHILLCKAVHQEQEALLAVVADGMGGLAFGEYASSCVTEGLQNWWQHQFLAGRQEQSLIGIKDTLEFVVEQIHEKIKEMAEQNHSSMGTTVSVIFLYGMDYVLLQVGDSRVYQLRKQSIWQLTTDQTWCQDEVAAGRMTQEEATVHKKRHVLSNALGTSQTFFIKSSIGTVQKKDRLLLCSDGYYTYLQEKELFRSCFQKNLQKVLERSGERIRKGKAEDNFSAILIEV